MTTPAEPPEWHLARIEAAAQLLASLPSCPHCVVEPVVVAWLESGVLPRAVGLKHQRGCPILAEWEAEPAATYEVPPS